MQVSRRVAGDDAFGQPNGRQDFTPIAGRVGLQVVDFRLDLRLELVAGSLELVQSFPNLPPDLG